MTVPHRPELTSLPPQHPVDVFLMFTDGDRILLALREGTGYRDGWWNVPSGKLEHDEDALTGVRREAFEEIGVRFTGDEPRFAGVVHHRNPEGQGRVALIFAAEFDASRHGEPVNREPHKCADIRWWPLTDELPPNTVPYTAAGIEVWRNGGGLQISGWQEQADRVLPRPDRHTTATALDRDEPKTGDTAMTNDRTRATPGRAQ
ncbi:hypothetical protein Q0Z83_111710 [Actinoplanes sichuanensis]|nr:hypothetical protein Q0Z83_111710 [Actinoplanes sichuanensis]